MGRGAFFAEQTRLSQVAVRAAPRSPGAPSMECGPTDLLDTSADVCEACRSGSTTHTSSRKQWRWGVGGRKPPTRAAPESVSNARLDSNVPTNCLESFGGF